MANSTNLLCVRCGTPEDLGETCSRCEGALVPRAELPPWGASRTECVAYVSLGAWPWVVGSLGFALVALNEAVPLPLLATVPLTWLALLPLAVCFAGSPSDSGGRPTYMTLAGALGTAGIVAAIMTPFLLWGPKLGRQRARWNAQHGLSTASLIGAVGVGILVAARRRRLGVDGRGVTALNALAAVSPKAAQEGRVHLVGTARVERPAVTPAGVRCAAWEERSVRIATVFAHPAGGVFHLETADNTPVRVFAEHVRVVHGSLQGDILVVPADATVEVLGQARWHTEPDAEALRDPQQVLEMRGTERQPILLRVV